jgi:hypothetical protein
VQDLAILVPVESLANRSLDQCQHETQAQESADLRRQDQAEMLMDVSAPLGTNVLLDMQGPQTSGTMHILPRGTRRATRAFDPMPCRQVDC